MTVQGLKWGTRLDLQRHHMHVWYVCVTEGKRAQRRSSFTEELHTERGLRLKKVSQIRSSLRALSNLRDWIMCNGLHPRSHSQSRKSRANKC